MVGAQDDTQAERRPIRIVIVALVILLVIILIFLLVLWGRDPVLVSPRKSGLESVSVITGPGSGDFPLFDRPLAAAFAPTGDIYVSDTGNGRICVFTEKGRFQREFGRVVTDTPPAQRAGALKQPAGIAVAEDGTVYVADLRGGFVMVYNSRGRYLRSFKPAGVAQAVAGWGPTDVAVSEDRIAVTDAGSVTLFSLDGQFNSSITEVRPNSPLVRPNGVAFTSDGSVVVADTNNARVAAFGPDGERLWVLENDSASGNAVGLPRGLSVAEDGSIVVADAFRFALIRISDEGQFLGEFGQRGSQAGSFEFPNDVDMRKDLALVADKENGRVQVVRLVGVFAEGNPQ